MQYFDQAIPRNASNKIFKKGINFSILYCALSCDEKSFANQECKEINKIIGRR